MKQIRLGVFETNSSSTHSMVICTEEQYEKLGVEYFIKDYTAEILTRREAIKLFKENHADEENLLSTLEDDAIISLINRDYEAAGVDKEVFNFDYDDPIGDVEDWAGEYLELDVNKFTTPSGDKMVTICRYGNDW